MKNEKKEDQLGSSECYMLSEASPYEGEEGQVSEESVRTHAPLRRRSDGIMSSHTDAHNCIREI